MVTWYCAASLPVPHHNQHISRGSYEKENRNKKWQNNKQNITSVFVCCCSPPLDPTATTMELVKDCRLHCCMMLSGHIRVGVCHHGDRTLEPVATSVLIS